jgi:hypothetical protein
MQWRAVQQANKGLAAAALACLLTVSSPVTSAAAPDIDVVRLQASYDNGPKRVRDAALEAHLAQLVKRITDANPDFATLAVTVHVLREPLPYAFLLDNGVTYVSTGLIARLSNETQLAGLIAAQVAGVVRHDDQTLHRTMRDRFVAQFIPSLVVITATVGMGTGALASAANRAEEAQRRKLQAASDAVALGWLERAGYDPREVPQGVQRLLDALTREQRFGTTELAKADTLTARVESFTQGLPPGDSNGAQVGKSSAADWWRPAARRFALEIAYEDLNNGRTTALTALLDSIEATDSPGGQTAFLRAQDLQKREPGQDHVADVIAAYERCIGYRDVPAIAFRELAFIYRSHGDAAQARSNFQQYLTRAPTSVDAPIIRGYLEGL